MKRAAKYFLVSLLFLVAWNSNAQVKWNEPEVVPEKLTRKNRRVLRFSGTTKPETQVRIRRNRIKLYLDNGKSRWAKIPQKNRVQFPVQTDGDGEFSFELYLPTVAVELPVEVRTKKGWVPYNLNFRVPNSGKANNFEAVKRSFMANDDDSGVDLDKSDNYYSAKNDKGMLIRDREGRELYKNSKIEAWGGLGFSFFDTSVSIPAANQNRSGSSLVLPSFAIGVDYKLYSNILLRGTVRSASGSTDDIGDDNLVTGKDFNWLQGQVSVLWYAETVKFTKKGRWAFDLGLQLQQLPYFRERPGGLANLTYFDSSTYNLHVGLAYQRFKNREWGYEFYGRYLYPVTSGDTFDIESGFPLFFEFGGGVRRPLTPGMSLGIYSQLNYFSSDVSYTDVTKRDSSLDLLLFTVEARLMVKF